MKILLDRFGGFGDLAPMTSCARVLKEKGHSVDIVVRDGGPDCVQSELLLDNPYFEKVMDAREIGQQQPVRCIKTQYGWIEKKAIYRDYDLVIDFQNSIENNNTSPIINKKPGFEWMISRNSNWRNWYDLSLEWCNIDPSTVPDDYKRPQFTLREGEDELFAPMRENFGKVFVLQPFASSLARTWYQAKHLPKLLLDRYPDALVMGWDPNDKHWVGISKKGSNPVKTVGSPLRYSMAMIAKADLFIGVDTGFSHVAEGLGVKNLVLYGTVPWWTRAKYYKFQTPIDMGQDDSSLYTFSLMLGDPNRVLEGIASFSEREKQLWEGMNMGKPPEILQEEMNTTSQGLRVEVDALKARLHSFEHQQSKALSMVTPKMVMENVERLLG